MDSYYLKYVKSPLIIKDINFFYKKIYDEIICKYFANYLLNVRKKSTEREFTVKNFLEKFNETRLKFINDTIVIRFSIDETSLNDKSYTTISKFKYKNDKVCDLLIIIDIKLSKVEFKSKLLYNENNALTELKKELTNINNYYIRRIQKSLKKRAPKLNKEFQKIKHTPYWEWNNLLRLLKDCTDTSFDDNLEKMKIIANGMTVDNSQVKHMVIKRTDFYNRYSSNKQIKADKLIKLMKNHCIDEDELVYLSDSIARCLGTRVKTIEETEEFLQDVIKHFNKICYSKNMEIAKATFLSI